MNLGDPKHRFLRSVDGQTVLESCGAEFRPLRPGTGQTAFEGFVPFSRDILRMTGAAFFRTPVICNHLGALGGVTSRCRAGEVNCRCQFGGPTWRCEFGGVICRSGLADLFGGPPGSGAGSIRDQSTRLDVITGRFQAGCVGRQQLALSELAPFSWQCQLAVSVGGPVWRCDLAVSVCGGSDLPQDSSASSHAKVAGSRASS